MRLNRAMLYGKDINRMADFYGKTVGLKAIDGTRMENWVGFEAGAIKFALHAMPSEIADHIERRRRARVRKIQ